MSTTFVPDCSRYRVVAFVHMVSVYHSVDFYFLSLLSLKLLCDARNLTTGSVGFKSEI